MLDINTVHQGDCLELMKDIPDGSIDMILCDLPYQTTTCSWDQTIPFEPLWEQYKRIVKPNAAIVLTAIQPFTSMLVMSNLSLFRYVWIWEKTLCSNYWNVKGQPAKKTEDIVVFYKKQPTYNPQMLKGRPFIRKDLKWSSRQQKNAGIKNKIPINNTGTRYPKNIIKFSNGNNKNIHPTQKPVALFEYLIKTYSNEGDLVLDNCAGSGTTGEACKNLNRNFILIEQDEKYCELIKERLSKIQPTIFNGGNK